MRIRTTTVQRKNGAKRRKIQEMVHDIEQKADHHRDRGPVPDTKKRKGDAKVETVHLRTGIVAEERKELKEAGTDHPRNEMVAVNDPHHAVIDATAEHAALTHVIDEAVQGHAKTIDQTIQENWSIIKRIN